MSKKKILIITLLLSFGSLLAQDRYLVYFKDKGSNQHNKLNKASAEYQQAEKSLSKKAIERRKKTMGENYITYEDLPISENYVDIIKNYGVEIHRELKWFNAVSCYLTEEQINQILILPFVEKIEKVRKLRRVEPKASKNEKDESFLHLNKSNQQNTYNYGGSFTQFNLVDVPPVHDAGINGSGIIIGLLDSGFRWRTHPAMQNMNVIAEHDFIYDDDNTDDEPGDSTSQVSHGTGTLSLVGGFQDGNLVAPSFGASFILSKTEVTVNTKGKSVETNVEEDNFVAGVEWMEGLGVDVITTSLGYSEFDAGQHSYTYSEMDGKTGLATKAYNEAFDRGVVTVTSAGNEGIVAWHYITTPADAFNVISVGAVNSSNSLQSFSSRGPTADGRTKPEVMAQGVNVFMANYTNTGYRTSQGTSFAAPVVAGITGMLLSAYPHLNNKQVREIVLASGDKTDNPNNDYGYGLLSAVRAINYPNIQHTTTGYTLHKIFLTKTIPDPNSVKINYSVNGGEFANAVLNYDGTLKYTYELNTVNEGDAIEFYFTFNNGAGEERVPADKNYLMHVENLAITVVDGPDNTSLPVDFSLSQNYPNPFNPSTNIKYNLPERSFVSLKVFDMLGQEIKSLVNSEKDAGNYSVAWNGTNDFGKQVSAGAYVYRMVAGNFAQSKKMILLR